ncbi:MAG: TonB-dependent receptor [Pseudomonadota bacterium]
MQPTRLFGHLRATTIAAALAGSTFLHAAPAAAQAVEYSIAASPLDVALNRFGAESGIQVIYDSAIADGLSSPGASGTLTPEDALAAVLSGTGLSYRFTSALTVVIEEVAPGGADEQGAITLDTIIVTARRTEEALQDVPASINVLRGEDVDRSNLNDFDDATLILPNVDFSGGDNPARIFSAIRGISDLNVASTGPTIGFFQDGVLQNNTGQTININRRIADVDRVEVIYGPQGTAFGRGTIGGAVNVVTNKPSGEFEASLRTELGSYFDYTGEAVINVPLTDDLSVRAVGYGEISDGFVDLPFGDTEDSISNDNAGGRFSVRYTPIDRLTIDTSVQFDTTDFDAPTFSIEDSVEDNDPIALNGTIDELEIERLNLIGEVAYQFDFGQLRSTTAFNRTTFVGGEDFDFTPPNNSFIFRDNKERAFSQELRFESESFDLPGRFGTVSTNLGFIYNDISAFLNPVFTTNFFGGPGGNVTDTRTDITNIGVFGDVRWRPVQQLELAAGARFSRDKVSIDSEIAPSGTFTAFVQPLVFADEETFTSITPNASILYEWTDDLSTYFSFTTGFRPGGFVGSLVGAPIQFDEEKVRSFEGGIKSTWLDGRLLLNASGFALFYDDIQVPISQEFGGGIQNAASARSIGAEVSAGAEPVPGLNLQAGLGLSFAKFTDFAEAVGGDRTGDRLPRAPRTSFTFIGDYEHPTPIARDIKPFGRVEYSFRSDFSGGSGGETNLGAFDVTNFRIGIRSEKIEVALFVENAFNEAYANEIVFPAAVANAAIPPEFVGQDFLVPGPTRRFGIVGTIKF